MEFFLKIFQFIFILDLIQTKNHTFQEEGIGLKLNASII